ncbi:MAG1210 family protein [Spiroplasma endosymbiont of Crioceris asparagi]|uniref:MAG1210 family protein n=1 Tax=Spiroplasma endosymbiont of Crioceris asparagi TaxID=3066286 RepID=UPI0030CA8734
MTKDIIYDPIDQYKTIKLEHSENSKNYFNELVKKSKIDVFENEKTVTKIKEDKFRLNDTANLIKRLKFWRLVTIILFVIAIFIPIFYYYAERDESNSVLLVTILLCLIPLIMLVILILVIKKNNFKINNLTSLVNKLEKQIDDNTNLAWEQVYDLNLLFDWKDNKKLIEKTLPQFKIFNQPSAQFENIFKNSGLSNRPKSETTYQIIGGTFMENPFMISIVLKNTISLKEYVGTKYITWKEGSSTKSEELVAAISKPFPEYHYFGEANLWSDFADKLSFQREPSNSAKISDKELKSRIKKLDKISEKAIKKNSNINLLNNKEFEVYFNCLNRSDETQYRLLFTPIAQRQLTKLIKSTTDNISHDYFYWDKNQKIHTLTNDFLTEIELGFNPALNYDYDFKKIQEKFLKRQYETFRGIYLGMTPLMSVPGLQESPREKIIYNDSLEQQYADRFHEVIANHFSEDAIKHPNSVTKNIIKSQYLINEGNIEKISISVHGYNGIPQIAIIPVRGGDGYWHDVEVPWIEYIPVTKKHILVVVKLTTKNTKIAMHNSRFKNLFQKNKINEDNVFVYDNLINFLTNDGELTLNQKQLVEDIQILISK